MLTYLETTFRFYDLREMDELSDHLNCIVILGTYYLIIYNRRLRNVAIDVLCSWCNFIDGCKLAQQSACTALGTAGARAQHSRGDPPPELRADGYGIPTVAYGPKW